MQIPYFFVCGVNTCGDDDSSFMAFSDAIGHNGCRWGDNWRGNSQKGTVWSAWSDDFTTDRGRICSSPQSFPGYKVPGGRSCTCNAVPSSSASRPPDRMRPSVRM